MTPLTNSTPHQDLRDWKKEEQRIRAFKESQWEKNFGFNPLLALAFTCLIGAMFAISLIYISSLFIKIVV